MGFWKNLSNSLLRKKTTQQVQDEPTEVVVKLDLPECPMCEKNHSVVKEKEVHKIAYWCNDCQHGFYVPIRG